MSLVRWLAPFYYAVVYGLTKDSIFQSINESEEWE